MSLLLNNRLVPQIQLFLPDGIDSKIIPETSIIHGIGSETTKEDDTLKPREKINNEVLLDSDNDGIPDDMETKGYTVMGRMLVPWFV